MNGFPYFMQIMSVKRSSCMFRNKKLVHLLLQCCKGTIVLKCACLTKLGGFTLHISVRGCPYTHTWAKLWFLLELCHNCHHPRCYSNTLNYLKLSLRILIPVVSEFWGLLFTFGISWDSVTLKQSIRIYCIWHIALVKLEILPEMW